jgi:signal transduction histidine kinase
MSAGSTGSSSIPRCFTRDITDRVLAEEALAQAKAELEEKVAQRTAKLVELVELKDRFVAMVSHELRTPLTSIFGFSATMERFWDALADAQKRGFVEIIGSQSQRLSRLVEDLLTLSRASAGTLEVREHVVDVRDAIDRTLRELGEESVAASCPAGLAVLADSDHVQQILLNYVTNARKYGRPPVIVEARPAEGFAEIRVRDEGEGVPDDFRERLFTEFAQRPLDQGSEPRAGTGLGLSIVRQLAIAQGGEAWYEPNEPRGAAFGVRLPLAS